MKKITFGFCTLFILFALMACGGSDNDESSSEPAVQELQVGETASGFIEKEGDVDTYHLRANEANKFLYIHCSEATSGSNVDLLVTVFGENNGQRTRLFGKHKPDGATLSADLDLWVYINEPKDLYITVRDFMDDDASSDIAYQLVATFQDSANGNHDFSNAQSVGVDAAQPTSDAISEIGEVDCFTFTPPSDGVYSVNIDHQKPAGGSPVQLAITLYDNNGNRIQRLEDPAHTVLGYLEAASGPYFVIVEDNDSRNSDQGAPYALSVDSVSVAEAMANDNVANPTVITPDAADTYTAVGAIDYGCSSLSPDHAADLDWYSFVIGSIGGSDFHQLELTIDDGATIDGTSPLRVTVFDSEMDAVTSYDFSPGSNAYRNNIRIQDGEYFISVAPANSKILSRTTTYQVQLSDTSTDDTYETSDENTQDTARPLTDGVPIDDGYVSYPADVDWYSIEVNTSNANILSVDFTAAATSIVDYQVSIWLGDTMIKKVTDADGTDIATHLKTSILIPATNPAGTPIYHIKVCDAQNNEGSNVAYTLRADIDAVPTASPGHGPGTSGTLYYYGETSQEAAETEAVELEIFSTLQPTFKANTNYLDFRNNEHIVQTSTGANTTEITFPWITGYADYQGDRDFFRIEFDKLDPSGSETTWYYDVEVRLVVPAGSDVEYVWKLYRDSNNNKIIQENPESEDGYKACAGDITPESAGAVDLTTPEGTDTFWIGSQWGAGNSFFYFGISDFNYLQLPGGGANTEPDDDWGYDQPYYFQIKLVYHNDRSCPTCEAGQ
jgi:hypothetical protein